MKQRTRARSLALQALFEIDLTGHPMGLVVDQRIKDTPLDESLTHFVRQIVLNVAPIAETLDWVIAEHAPEWPMDQVAYIDRNILRIALWEIAIFKETPLKVAINEAVELAKEYGSDGTPRFVNGVLGSLTDHLNEVQQTLQSLIKSSQKTPLDMDTSPIE
jgi:N utilization substance protein B